MPDLKTALSTALSTWEQDDKQIQQERKVRTLPQQFVPTNNVTQETFNYVKNNPNKNSSEIRIALVARGFNAGSIGSLLAQFTKQNRMAKDQDGRYVVCSPNYAPLKASKNFRTEDKRKNKTVAVKPKPRVEGIAALTPQSTTKTQWDADTIINNIGLKQARALYDELKKLFGG